MGVSYAAAFVAGLVTFASPCVLPLVPVYVSFITGMSAAELAGAKGSIWRILVPILLFVAGFSLVVVSRGASASAIGAALHEWRPVLERVAGVVAIVLGILLLDLIRLPWSPSGTLLDAGRIRSFGPVAALVLGVVFPLAIGPCSGPVFGAILLLAGSSRSLVSGAALLGVYSLGLAVPFVVSGLLFGRLAGGLSMVTKHARTVNRVAGVVLIVFGALLATGLFGTLEAELSRSLPFLGPFLLRFG